MLQLDPHWLPSEEEIRNSNIQRWCDVLGLPDYRALHHWSINRREEFWQAVVHRLGIRFDVVGDTVLANAHDPARAIWFPDAKMNIVNSCFQAPDDHAAIVWQIPGSPIQTMTVAELRAMTFRVANSLFSIGFSPGDRLAVVLPMTCLAVPIYLGAIALGCSIVSIADSFAAPEIATRLRISEAKGIFTYDSIHRGGKKLPLYQRVCDASNLPVIVLQNHDSADQSKDTLSTKCELRSQDRHWRDFLSDDEHFVPHVASANDCINVLFSSGTTGEPKAIVWNHLTPLRCGIDGHVHQNIQAGDVVVWPTNLGWMMGPWLIFASLLNRATIGLYEDVPMGVGFGRFIEQAKVNMLGVVPTIVKSWRESRVMEQFDWSSIRCFSSTGETSHPDDMRYLSSLAGGKPIIEYCGGTEIGGGYVTSTVVQPNVAAAFSTAAIGLDFLLLDENFETTEQGEVYIVPPSIGLSNVLLNRDNFETYYAGLPNGPAGEVLRRHGDYFSRSGDYFVAGGRTDDTMNLGGIKVSSAELERVLNQVEGVRETAAVALAEQHGPDSLVVFVVLEKEVDLDLLKREMNQRLKLDLNPLFRVDRVEPIDALPRTASNKVMRRELRSLLLNRK